MYIDIVHIFLRVLIDAVTVGHRAATPVELTKPTSQPIWSPSTKDLKILCFFSMTGISSKLILLNCVPGTPGTAGTVVAGEGVSSGLRWAEEGAAAPGSRISLSRLT